MLNKQFIAKNFAVFHNEKKRIKRFLQVCLKQQVLPPKQQDSGLFVSTLCLLKEHPHDSRCLLKLHSFDAGNKTVSTIFAKNNKMAPDMTPFFPQTV